MNRSTYLRTAAFIAIPLTLAACTTDFDRFNSGGGGVGGSGSQTVTTSTGGAGGEAPDPCAGVDCADTNPCTDDACVAGACPHGLAVNPNLITLQTDADCQVIVCAGSPPAPASMADNLDTPVSDSNDCTLDECAAGVPYPFATLGTNCNTTGVCDDMGLCSDCNVPADCGTDGDCGVYTCNGNSCGTNPDSAGTVASPDTTTGNCQSNVCDGTSINSAPGADNTDLPADVANDCKDPACNSGVPGTTNQSTGTACDDAGLENGGQCLAGACVDCTTNAGCDVGRECLGNNTCCTPMLPAAVCVGAIECGMASNGCVGMVDCGLCTGEANGEACISNACGCAAAADCDHAGSDGDDCLSGSCGCDADNDCSVSDRGEDCITANGVCGCVEGDQANDCSDSIYGRDCLATVVCGCTVANQAADCPATAGGRTCIADKCGCTEANQATDCLGIGAVDCDPATGLCIP